MGSDLARYSKSVANLGTRNFGEKDFTWDAERGKINVSQGVESLY
jgi:hypothetical protein